MGVPLDLPDFDALWDFARPDASERAFRELLQLAATSEAETYRLELLTKIARAQGLQRRFDDAHHTLDQVELGLTEATPRARLRYLLERGRVLNTSGSRQQAMPIFLDAWEIGLASGEDALAIDAAHMLAIVEPAERQLSWNLRALDLAERSADPRAQRWLGSLCNNIGWTYHDQERYEEALEFFARALAWREVQGEPGQIITARWAVGRVLRSLHRGGEALAIQRDLLSQLDERGESDPYVHEELAENLLALGRAAEAGPHFAAAYRGLSVDEWLAEHEPVRLQRLQELGQGMSSADASP